MTVYSGRRSHPSARRLERALLLAGYMGRDINFGYVGRPNAYNSRLGRGANKRNALLRMAEAGVPVPSVYDRGELEGMADSGLMPTVVGRPDRHRAGQHFYLCRDIRQVRLAHQRGATHYLHYIDDGREFRVHIAFGKSIKLAEKIGGNRIIRNFEHGSTFMYPDFNHKKSLRAIAKQAVEALELDFGAVDIIYKDGKFYVLEVNTAPSLTSRSDVLDRYVKAFMAT